MEDKASIVQAAGMPVFNACSFCGSKESETIKHKRCSACRQRLYCSSDCQKQDWKQGHKEECKKL